MRTMLYDSHKSLGGKVIDFHGWELPVQYEGIVSEHLHVRNYVGIFDVSHMGEILVSGKESTKFLQYLLTADIKDSYSKQKCVYSIMCTEGGYTVDDLIVYGIGEDRYFLVVNASNTDKDFKWIKEFSKSYDVKVENVTEKYAQIAIQGPKSMEVLSPLCNFDLSELKFFKFKTDAYVMGVPCIISRTGYTGEDGFEIYISSEKAVDLWNELLKNEQVKPIGLGARDTLRFEACLPLYGQELSESITPVEAGLSRFVRFEKGDFIGAQGLKSKERCLIGLKLEVKGIPRSGYRVCYGGEDIGYVTTGNFSPTLEGAYAMCLVDNKEYALDEFQILIRNKSLKAKKVEMPFYQKNIKNKRSLGI